MVNGFIWCAFIGVEIPDLNRQHGKLLDCINFMARRKVRCLLIIYKLGVMVCTGVCTDRHLATSLITSSQPLMLLLAAAVYDLPTGTVSLCLAVDSAPTAVVLSTMPARQSGTR